MEERAYAEFRARLDAWLEGNPPQPIATPGRVERAAPLLAVLARARAAAAGIAALCPELTLRDGNKYDFVAERIGDLINFETFSLAEYSYSLKGGRTPGLRLWHRAAPSLVEVVLFEDVLIWRVDERGQKKSRLVLTLDVSGPEPVARPAASAGDLVRPGPWDQALIDAMAAPLRLYA